MVITSALHAEGPRFEPGRDHDFCGRFCLLFSGREKEIRNIWFLKAGSLQHHTMEPQSESNFSWTRKAIKKARKMTYFFRGYCTAHCYCWVTFKRFAVKCAVKMVPFSWLFGLWEEKTNRVGQSGSRIRTFSHFFSPFLFWRKIEVGCSLRTIANQPRFSPYFLKPKELGFQWF